MLEVYTEDESDDKQDGELIFSLVERGTAWPDAQVKKDTMNPLVSKPTVTSNSLKALDSQPANQDRENDYFD